jgi:predicted DNA repair protein MutK
MEESAMFTGLLALLDDLTLVLDDVAALTKVAAKKTAGIATDDLAVNAEALVGFEPARELPIIGKVFLASLLNKVWLVPLALRLGRRLPLL